MAKLSKRESAKHREACEVLKKDVLTEDDCLFVFENWRPDATHDVSYAGAFFTPWGLARDAMVTSWGGGDGRLIDLCAGIGTLAWMYDCKHYRNVEITCIERNPAFIEVGKKILPNATWIQADVFDVLGMDLGYFDHAVSNPPFGNVQRNGKTSPRYTGSKFEYHVIDIAAHLAESGSFITPAQSTPFRCSSLQAGDFHQHIKTREHEKFEKQTGIIMEWSSVDTGMYKDEWQGVSPVTEVSTCEFPKLTQPAKMQLVATAPQPTVQADLFAA